MSRKAAFHTLGCRVNAYETEAMTELLRADGYEIVPFDCTADVYVINTCTVTAIADRKSRQMLHRARELNPKAVVVAVGCYAEHAGEAAGASGDADLVIGNTGKSRLAELLRDYLSDRDAGSSEGGEAAGREEPLSGSGTALPPVHTAKEYEPLFITETEGRTRAFLKIQDGCNQFCSYCMIPYVRGRVRSRREEDVLAEARRLSEAGYHELILTGIHISSYGMDFDHPEGNPQTPMAAEAETNRHLLTLLRKTAALPEVRRLRFGSLEPGIMTEEFVEALAEIPEVCPQFHLSLQSGCDATLSRMNRRYDTASFALICGRLRKAFADPAITTDLIVGFPGETEEEFGESAAFVERMQFAGTHIFKYSIRQGTRAAKMKGQVREQEKRSRSERLLALDLINRHRYAEHFLNREVEVLFEERKTVDGEVYDTGHTREALDVLCRSAEELSGRILTCLVEEVKRDGTVLVRPRHTF